MKNIKVGSIVVMDKSWSGDNTEHYAEVLKKDDLLLQVKTFKQISGYKDQKIWGASPDFIKRVVSE